MRTPDVVSGLLQTLKDTGLADLPGKMLYSGIETLSPGRLYVLGWNPGGDPHAESKSATDDLVALAERSPDWNEYVDGVWRPGGRICAPGDAPMQRRVRHLLTGIGLSVRTVCASNMVFVRSRASADLDGQARLPERCWPVHEAILEYVRPAGILSIGGNPVFDFIKSRGQMLSGPETFPSGHGNWDCLTGQVQLGGHSIRIVSVPHLARYAIDHHPDVAQWVSGKLGFL
jgi:hypothetical protein